MSKIQVLYVGACVSQKIYAGAPQHGWWKGGAWPTIRSVALVEARLAPDHMFGCHGPPKLTT